MCVNDFRQRRRTTAAVSHGGKECLVPSKFSAGLLYNVQVSGQTHSIRCFFSPTVLSRNITISALYAIFYSQRIIDTLVNDQIDCSTLISRFQEFLEYDDVRYFAMKSLTQQMKDRSEKVGIMCWRSFEL